MSSESLLVLSNVARSYRAGMGGCAAAVEVLRGISLDVRAGQFVLVEGAPASGKTTLLLCAAGLLRPDSGTVQWPVLASRTTQAPREVRYVGDRATTYGFLTVRESLAYATTVREIDHPRAPAPVNDPIDLAELRDVTGTRVALLSRGERARFLVALALTSAPRLLIVDDLVDDCDAAAASSFGAILSRVAGAGYGVLWAARSPGAIPATRAFELVRGRLRDRCPVTAPRPERREVPVTPIAAPAPTVQRVAEP
jgi:ABC-type multidrug transport system ATPase subunit